MSPLEQFRGGQTPPHPGTAPIAFRLSPEGHDPRSTGRVPVIGRLRRLLILFFLLPLGADLALGAVIGVLLRSAEVVTVQDHAARWSRCGGTAAGLWPSSPPLFGIGS